MAETFTTAVAHILYADSDAIAGLGFVASTGRRPIVITTANVVAQALGKDVTAEDLNAYLLKLVFPGSGDSAAIVEARVLDWFPVGNADIANLAVLQILKDLPQPLPILRKVNQVSEIGAPFKVLGFRKIGDSAGRLIEGRFHGQLLNKQLQAISFAHTPYFSDFVIEGSPAFDDDIGAFVGIVSRITRQENVYSYFITPLSTLALAYPELVYEQVIDTQAAKLGELFMSYGSIDGQEFVERLHDDLEAKGFSVWLDRRDIREGYNWNSEIDRGLRTAQAILVTLTPASVLSEQVESEWNNGLKRHLPVIPLLVRDCEIPRRLQMVQYVDFRRDYASAFAQLIARLENLDRDHPIYLKGLLESYLQAQKASPNERNFEYKITKLREALHTWESRAQMQEQQALLQHQRIASDLTTEIERKQQEIATAAPEVEEAVSLSLAGERLKDISAYFRDRINQRKE
ncbi:MAG: toll/interleukin-1 receptor domain-containing protein, partial [Anaerolineae bacterium]|nr:toll/interleukin-1 receptor domain-containing protein [Anaerolineae bacterium]